MSRENKLFKSADLSLKSNLKRELSRFESIDLSSYDIQESDLKTPSIRNSKFRKSDPSVHLELKERSLRNE